MHAKAGLLLVLLLLFVAACGGSDDGGSTEGAATDETPTEATETTDTSATETAEEAADLQTFEVESAGFSLGVPSSWTGLSGDEFTKSGTLEEFGKENPSLAPYLNALQADNSPMKLLAADPELEGAFATNVNVLVQDVPEGTSAKDYADLNRSGLSSSLDIQGTIQTEEVDHEVGDAAVARYRANLSAGGRQRTFSFVQYYFVNGTDAYVVTYTTVPGAEDRYRDDFEASAGSFRFL
jgi:hypothetical protein